MNKYSLFSNYLPYRCTNPSYFIKHFNGTNLILKDRSKTAISVAPIHLLVLCNLLPSCSAPCASKPMKKKHEQRFKRSSLSVSVSIISGEDGKSVTLQNPTQLITFLTSAGCLILLGLLRNFFVHSSSQL